MRLQLILQCVLFQLALYQKTGPQVGTPKTKKKKKRDGLHETKKVKTKTRTQNVSSSSETVCSYEARRRRQGEREGVESGGGMGDVIPITAQKSS